jgi:seryl-tRNA synthetase
MDTANDMREVTPIINWGVLAKAQKYYANSGFIEIPVPWIINFESYSATKPKDREDFYTLGGYLNASAEQSLIQMRKIK